MAGKKSVGHDFSNADTWKRTDHPHEKMPLFLDVDFLFNEIVNTHSKLAYRKMYLLYID
jgi:hypothetical protein